MLFPVITCPRERFGVSLGSEWRSLGEIADCVLDRASRLGDAPVLTIRHAEIDDALATMPIADFEYEGALYERTSRDRQAL